MDDAGGEQFGPGGDDEARGEQRRPQVQAEQVRERELDLLDRTGATQPQRDARRAARVELGDCGASLGRQRGRIVQAQDPELFRIGAVRLSGRAGLGRREPQDGPAERRGLHF